VAVYLIHAPNPTTPFEEKMEAIHKLYLEGRFEQVSNYVLATVYQGSYSLLSRNIESDLFPVLRSLNIAFHAYSPIAGGFLAATPDDIANPTEAFNKPELLKYLEKYIQLLKDTGISQAEIAYRWARFHSNLDGARGNSIVVGASSPKQLDQTLLL
ncbi:NADP-dependent oxidoreductase domain-containing protein, partial [Pterulicium gracile]